MDIQLQQELEKVLTVVEQSIQQEFPQLSIRTILESLQQSTVGLDLKTVLQQLIQALCGDLSMHCSVLGHMILLAIFYALLRQMLADFAGDSIQTLCGMLLQALAILLLLQSGSKMLAYGQQAVLRMAELMQLLLPVQLGLMATLGNIQTAGLLQPSMMLIVQGTVWLFRTVLLPLITIEFVLKLVNSFNDTYQLGGLVSFFRKLIFAGMTFSTMLLLAVLSIQGISGHILDSLSLRTVKYVAGAAIPVVGSTISGLMETLLGGAAMIRTAAGVLGLLAVIILTMIPALKLLLVYFMYTFAAAVLQPIGDTKITGLLNQAAESYMLLFAIVALTGVFFFFMILIVLSSSGIVLGS